MSTETRIELDSHLETTAQHIRSLMMVASGIAELEDIERAECDDCYDAEEAIRDLPLEVLFRSGWSNDPSTLQLEECEIVLTTGGPDIRIEVIIGDRGVIHSAELVGRWSGERITYRGDCSDCLEQFADSIIGSVL